MAYIHRDSWWRYVVVGLVAGAVLYFSRDYPLLWWTGSWTWIPNAVLSLAALFAMRWRHRHPLGVTLALSVAALIAPGVSVSAHWAYLSLCTHRNNRWALIGGVALYASIMIEHFKVGDLDIVLLRGEPLTGGWAFLSVAGTYAINALVVLLLAVWGNLVGSRREARQAELDRIEALERERELRAEAARAEERASLAREMHDVLAHKISLIAMHAGAMAYRDDLQQAETRAAAQTICASAQQALAELRTILGGLRQTGADGAVLPPQPSLADLDALLKEHRQVGRRIDASIDVTGEPGRAVGRHAYRIIQECLTNSARHAPGARVQLRVLGSEGHGLEISVANSLSVARVTSPGSGLGLVGLQERVELLGGKMSAGPKGRRFVVEVWLPW